MRNKFIFSFITFLLFSFNYANGQNEVLEIRFMNDRKSDFIKRGSFVQCIANDTLDNQKFYFGKVSRVMEDGLLLEKSEFIRGSGGFFSYHEIENIQRIKVLRRSILPALIVGIAIGQLVFFKNIPMIYIGPLAGIASVFVVVKSLKTKRRSLLKNIVNKSIVLIPPKSGEDKDIYFR